MFNMQINTEDQYRKILKIKTITTALKLEKLSSAVRNLCRESEMIDNPQISVLKYIGSIR